MAMWQGEWGERGTAWQFEHATVSYMLKGSRAGMKGREAMNRAPRLCERLSIMVIDAYRYQRELSIEYRHTYNVETGKTTFAWHLHAYLHPGVRSQTELSPAVARRLIDRILYLTVEYPTLLFNAGTPDRARSEGFVHFHDMLLRGIEPSAKLLAA